jgi:hypothetical protein
MNRKGFTGLITLIVIGGLLALGAGIGLRYYQDKKGTTIVQPAVQPPTTEKPSIPEAAMTPNKKIVQPQPGQKIYKLLVVEFVPKNVKYASICYLSIGNESYSIGSAADGKNFAYSICPPNTVEERSFLEIVNDTQGQFVGLSLSEHDKISNPHSFFYINEYIQKQAARYSFLTPPYFNIEVKGPFELNEDCAPVADVGVGGLKILDQDFFKKKIKDKGIDDSEYDFIAVAYFSDRGITLDFKCPSYSGLAEGLGKGKYVYLSTDTAEVNNDRTVITFIHEIFHLFGATDKYVISAGIGASHVGPDWCHIAGSCATEDAIPNPGVYPQTQACLYSGQGSGAIVRKFGFEEMSAVSLDQVLICDKDAEELGWKK